MGTSGVTETKHMIKFSLGDLKQVTEYVEDWELYLSKQDILDKEEKEKLKLEISSVFNKWSSVDLTLDQLRRIHSIISE
ncbi:hypothetical protein [Bacillus nakamurai]|uniref:hypothetical protein n=1 Tax=Bacillus nakamurai TaxID=1793963 RepID=UPI001E35F97E|nr:hypothetical protein [Bacillus nakamurai]MCC9021783.1 hypothetical protein [Bacillus nakamurai]